MASSPTPLPTALVEAAAQVRHYAVGVHQAQIDFLADLIRLKSYTGQE